MNQSDRISKRQLALDTFVRHLLLTPLRRKTMPYVTTEPDVDIYYEIYSPGDDDDMNLDPDGPATARFSPASPRPPPVPPTDPTSSPLARPSPSTLPPYGDEGRPYLAPPEDNTPPMTTATSVPVPSTNRRRHHIPRVVFISGLGADRHMWHRQIASLRDLPPGSTEVLVLDNRGIGKSSVPRSPKSYSIHRMALDVRAVLRHVGWLEVTPVHIVGHSMGSCVALALVTLLHVSVASLTLLSWPGPGGLRSMPPLRGLYLMWKASRCKTDAQRVATDLQCHYSRSYLASRCPHVSSGWSMKTYLHHEYLSHFRSHGQQALAGEKGQVRAVMKWRLLPVMRKVLRSSTFPVSIIHGFHDVICKWQRSAQLAHEVGALAHLTSAGHFVSVESCDVVNAVVLAHVLGDERVSEEMERIEMRSPSKEKKAGGKKKPRQGVKKKTMWKRRSSRSGGEFTEDNDDDDFDDVGFEFEDDDHTKEVASEVENDENGEREDVRYLGISMGWIRRTIREQANRLRPTLPPRRVQRLMNARLTNDSDHVWSPDEEALNDLQARRRGKGTRKR